MIMSHLNIEELETGLPQGIATGKAGNGSI